MVDAYQGLIEGYRTFRREYLDKQFDAYRSWASKAQNPRTLIIGCSDSRVNPAILTHAGLGEIFVVNNVANIVPPYEKGKSHHKSLGAAIQFAVNHLRVEHIIVMGHSGCGGIAALMAADPAARYDADDDDYIADWVSILQPAREAVEVCCDAHVPDHEKRALAEMEGTLVSVSHLISYPWVRQAVDAGVLSLHAWYFHVDSGELLSFSSEKGRFCRV